MKNRLAECKNIMQNDEKFGEKIRVNKIISDENKNFYYRGGVTGVFCIGGALLCCRASGIFCDFL